MIQNKKQTDRWQSKDKCIALTKRFGDYNKYSEQLGNRSNKPIIFNTIFKLMKENKEPMSVLDVGCGPGHFMWTIKDKCAKIIGVDNSKYMLEIFNQQFSTQKTPYETRMGSCWDIPVKENFADMVVQVDLCMHVGGSYQSILEMIRVSRKYVIFTGPSFEKFDNVMDKQIDKISWAVSVPLLTKELKKLKEAKIIKEFSFIDRPRTKTYNHKILVIEK